MDAKLKDSIKKEFEQIQAPQSLFDFAYQVPDLVENKGEKMKGKKKGFKKSLYAVTAAVACSALFTFGVNISPSFAGYIEKIPVLAQISAYIQGVDKVADNVIETVAYSATNQNIAFTVDRVIADSKRTILLYHAMMENTNMGISSLKLENYTITDDKNQLIVSRKDGSWTTDEKAQFLPRWTLWPGELESDDPSKLLGMMELVSQDGTAAVPKEVRLSIEKFTILNKDGEPTKAITGVWDINVPLDADKVVSKPIEYGEQSSSIEVGNQQLDLHINFTKVYPTMTEISMDLLTEIDGGILYDYHVEDEDGVIYKHVEDGIMTDTGNVLPQFESSYFNEPKTLYLVINNVTMTTRIGDSFKDEVFKINKKIQLN